MLVRYMDSTYKKLVYFLAGFLFPITNHDLLFALELAEVWYDQSWQWICISPAPQRPGSHSGRGTKPIYASVDQTMMAMNSRSLLPRLLLPTYDRTHLATLPKDTRLWICAHGRIIRTLRYSYLDLRVYGSPRNVTQAGFVFNTLPAVTCFFMTVLRMKSNFAT